MNKCLLVFVVVGLNFSLRPPYLQGLAWLERGRAVIKAQIALISDPKCPIILLIQFQIILTHSP